VLLTLRLQVDILELARSSGQRSLTPKREAPDTSDTDGDQGDGDDEAELKPPAADGAAAGPSKPPVKRRKKKVEWYDVDDDFIDDSEIHLDERTTFAQTKQKGFYVSQGEVALVREKFVVSVRPLVTLWLTGLAGHPGSRRRYPSSLCSPSRNPSPHPLLPSSRDLQHPPRRSRTRAQTAQMALDLASHGRPRPHRPRSAPARVPSRSCRTTRSASGRRLRLRPEKGKSVRSGRRNWLVAARRRAENSLTGCSRRRSSLQNSRPPSKGSKTRSIKVGTSRAPVLARRRPSAENWGQKGKFPPTLKPPLKEVAILAIRRNEYDDNFFDYMPTIFPYNRYTMTVRLPGRRGRGY
jgi:hypothetical protein